jgi:hypothetical protein
MIRELRALLDALGKPSGYKRCVFANRGRWVRGKEIGKFEGPCRETQNSRHGACGFWEEAALVTTGGHNAQVDGSFDS